MTRRIAQVKVPVTDLARSAGWYATVFGLHLVHEFVEDGDLTGVVLTDDARSFLVGLRRRDVIPGQPAFPGFDLFSLGVDSRAELEEFAARLDELDVPHGPVVDRGFDAALDVPDPDGTVVRLLSPFSADAPPFLGVEFTDRGAPDFYDDPRLPGGRDLADAGGSPTGT
jgi:catechol 2,3-dioxygenase-like lactoylglutathione lyase family enzyme